MGLEPLLKSGGYKVLRFEPWKYTQDPLSIKRIFLINIYDEIGFKYNEDEFYLNTKKEENIPTLETIGVFFKKIGFWIVFTSIAILGTVVVIQVINFFSSWGINVKDFIINNFLLVALAGTLPIIKDGLNITTERPVPKTASAEQFEKKFNKVIGEIIEKEKKLEGVVIFVDDLDRCSPKDVEQVLTALFTFFNNPLVTYVITADHTVIRRYIEKFLEIIPGADSEEESNSSTKLSRNKDATEYLKKIFQINWILPRITPDALKNWIELLLEGNKKIIKLDNPYAKNYLVELIQNNLDGNPRKIKHLIRILVFLLEVTKEKLGQENIKKGDKKKLEIIMKSPELLAKMLIIEDEFPDFYEKFQKNPKLIKEYEKGKLGDSSDDEEKKMHEFIIQDPKFFDSPTRTENRNIDPANFIYLSGTIGFVERKTVDTAKIIGLARTADLNGLKDELSVLTDTPLIENVESVRDSLLDEQVQPQEKINTIRSLFHAVSLIEESEVRLNKIHSVIEMVSKYAEEMKSIQPMDITIIAPYVNNIIATKLLQKDPFTEVNLRNQVWSGFLEAQEKLQEGVMTSFVGTLTDKLTASDEEFQSALGFINKLKTDFIENTELFSSGLIDSLESKIENNDQTLRILETIVRFKGMVGSSDILRMEKLVSKLIEAQDINRNIFAINSILTPIKDIIKINNISRSLVLRIKNASLVDKNQIIDSLNNITSILSQNNIDDIVEAILEDMASEDVDKYKNVISKMPILMKWTSRKELFIDLLLAEIKDSPVVENQEILNNLWNQKEIIINNESVKKGFIIGIKKILKRSKDDSVKSIIKSILDEAAPPKNKKLKK